MGMSLSVGEFGKVSVAAVMSTRQNQKAARILAVKQIGLESYSQTRRDLLLQYSLALSADLKHKHVVSILGKSRKFTLPHSR